MITSLCHLFDNAMASPNPRVSFGHFMLNYATFKIYAWKQLKQVDTLMPVVRIRVSTSRWCLLYKTNSTFLYVVVQGVIISVTAHTCMCIYVHLLISLSACTCRIVPCGSPPGNGSGQHPSTPSHLDTHHHSHYKGGLCHACTAQSTHTCTCTWHCTCIHGSAHNMLCISRMNQLLLNDYNISWEDF